MKGEKNKTCLTGFLLAWLVSWGVAGSLVTGFNLYVENMGALLWLCGLAAAVSALCFRFRWGGVALTGLLLGTGWLLWRDDRSLPQTLFFLKRLMTLFNNAYGWGVPDVLQNAGDPGSLGGPVAVLAAFSAVGVSRTACRRSSLTAALFAAVLPMALCFVVTDTVPDEKYLFVWMLGVTLLVLTHGVRKTDGSQGVTLTAMAAVPAALTLALLFWLVPREGYDKHPQEVQQRIVNWIRELPELWEETTDEVASALSGAVQPSEVNLRTLGPRLRKVYPVMEVTAPESGTLYLRGQDYDLYDGMGWTATRHRMETFSSEGMTSRGNVTVATRRVRDVLYLPYYPGNGITLVGGQLDNAQALEEYSFFQWSLPGDWRQQIREAEAAEPDSGAIVLTLSAEPAPDDRRYLTLPNDTQVWAVELLKTILTDEKTATAVADTIGAYVKNSARYDLNTARMTGEHTDFAQWFLEESETGYCVHFATAATVLLRAAGVEARYVEGYMTNAQAGTAVTVTEDQAHAWAEYYEPVLDTWIVLEATPADMTEHPEPTAPETQQSDVDVPPAETEGELSTEPARETDPNAEQDRDGSGTGDSGEADRSPSGLWNWVSRLLPAAAVAGAVWWQRKLRLAYRRKLQRTGSGNTRALARWQELEGLCRLLKTPCPEEMEHLAQKAKYSPHAITGEELRTMDDAIRMQRQALQAAPWYKILVYKYIFAML